MEIKEEKQLNQTETKQSRDFDKIANHWQTIIMESEHQRKRYFEKILYLYQISKGIKIQNNYPLKNKQFSMKGYEVVEDFVARISAIDLQVVFDNEKLTEAETAINDFVEEKDFESVQEEISRDLAIYGVAYVKTILSGFSILHPTDVLYPPFARRLNQADYIIHRMIKPGKRYQKKCQKVWEEAKVNDKPGAFPIKKPVTISSHDNWKRDFDYVDELVMGQIYKSQKEADEQDQDYSSDDSYVGYIVYEIHDFVKKEVVLLVKHSEGCSVVAIQPLSQVNPFLEVRNYQRNQDKFGTGLLEPIAKKIEDLSNLINRRRENIDYILSPIIVRKKPAEGAKPLIWKPGAEWDLKSINEIDFIKFPEISGLSYQDELQRSQEIQTTVSQSPYAQGQPQSATEPVSKVITLIDEADKRKARMKKTINEAMKKLVLKVILWKVLDSQGTIQNFKAPKVEVLNQNIPEPAQKFEQGKFIRETFVSEKPSDNPNDQQKWIEKYNLAVDLLSQGMGLREDQKNILMKDNIIQ